jgi:hypothetical protein
VYTLDKSRELGRQGGFHIPINFFQYAIEVWKRMSVPKVREPVKPYYPIDFLLRLLLHFWVKNHGQQESGYHRNCLDNEEPVR